MTLRSFRHWTPRYIRDRLNEIIYQRRFPDRPWLTAYAVEFLDGWLLPTDIAVEFGSGRSTLWFAKRVAKLTSVEHDAAWHERVSGQINTSGIQNVTYLFFDEDETTVNVESSQYVSIITGIEDNSVDFTLIDGIFRGYCARKMADKIRPGGLLAVDNANWFLPCESRSPGSRNRAQGPSDGNWAEFLGLVSGWRCFWTTSGVTDTALYFKPCNGKKQLSK